VSFVAITFCVASQQVLIVVSTYFITDSVQKLLETPSCMTTSILTLSSTDVNTYEITCTYHIHIKLFYVNILKLSFFKNGEKVHIVI
jgi:hypothetical protein